MRDGFFSKLNYNSLKEWIWPILIVTIVGLVGALFSLPIAGVRRWIRVGHIGIQPAEFAKLASVIFLAYYLDRKRSKVDSLVAGLVVPGAVVSVMLLLIGKEPDLGTPVLMFSVMLLMLFIGGARLSHVFMTLGSALPLVAYEI